MTLLSDNEKEQINQQIRAAESGTDGEIVTVITHSSDDYTYIPLLWATLAALALPGIYFLLTHFSNNGWNSSTGNAIDWHWLYLMQVALFFLFAMLVQWEPIKMRLIPASVRRARAAANARSLFLSQHMHWTDHRAGILIFVSQAEHYVEILVDQALADKVETPYWQATVDRFIENIKAGKTAQGFTSAIEDCRVVLWQHYPTTRSDGHSLPDHLIEV